MNEAVVFKSNQHCLDGNAIPSYLELCPILTFHASPQTQFRRLAAGEEMCIQKQYGGVAQHV